MNQQDLERLDAWRHGRISESEFDVLQDRLWADAQLRAELRALADVEAGLSALAATAGALRGVSADGHLLNPGAIISGAEGPPAGKVVSLRLRRAAMSGFLLLA